MVVNSAGAVTYYGRLGAAQSGDNKTVTVDLAGKYGDGDKLYVFNEQYNGDYMTDYASQLKEIAKPQPEPDYKVIFDANVPMTASTTCTGSMENQHFTHDEKKALSKNTYSLPGYDFDGWNTKSDGSGTAYADKTEVQGLSEDGSTVTLYAQWSGKPYTIEYWSDDAGSQKHVQTAYFDRPGKLDTYSDSAFSWNSGGKTLHGWSCTGSGSFLKNGDDFWNLCGEPDASGNVADPVIVADWVQNGQIIVTVTKDGTPQEGMADCLDLAQGSTVFNVPVAYENGKYVFDPASVSDSGGQVAPLPPGEYDIQFSTFVYPPASAQITYGEEHAVSVVFDYYTVSLAKDPVYADFNSVEIIGGEGNTVIARDGDMLGIKTTVAQGYRFENYSAVGVAPIWEGGDPTKVYQAITVQGKSDISAHVAPIGYSVTVLADPTVGGTVTGGGIYANGASATVTATAEDGYTFVNWTEIGDNNVETHVSNDASYLFTVESNRTLIANFSEGTGDLKIKNSGDSDSTFTVTLSDMTIHGDYGDMKFKNGVYTGTLSKGNSVTATGLPAGISFSVIEGTEADVATLIVSGGTVTVAGGTAENAGESNGMTASCGVAVDGAVTVSGGTVTAKGGDNVDRSFGVSNFGGLTLSRGTFTAVGGAVTGEDSRSYGITSIEGQAAVIQSGVVSVTVTGTTQAFDGTVKNTVAGTGWTDIDGTKGETAIPVNSAGGTLDGFCKVQFGASGQTGDVSDWFTDVSKTAWYHDAVQWAVDQGLMNGVSDTKFAPNGTATRAMVVTMVWRLAGEPAANSPAPFADVKDGAWYAPAVAWAAETGAVNGTSGTTFSPNTPVTREQLAVILYRYAQAQGKGFTGAWMFPLDYSDTAEVSEWANEAMHWMTMNGIITGMDDGTLAPKDNATRAQIATMFMRFVEAMSE